ncbi:MAG: class I SAM-dependent methyltransferase [Beijerinckiaceae bacterium]|nr:class I SAM-dependent methyltransferase [Beijerinckiaceae bacterium]
MKSKPMLSAYSDRLQDRTVTNLLELGIMKGGSTALFNAMATPQNHMAVDVYKHESGLDVLAEIVANEGRKLLARYDISQSDTKLIVKTFEEHFGVAAEFDVIIDDASHNYDLSLASFNGLFGRVKPGGFYAIEDWGWAHWGGAFQQSDHPEFGNTSLSTLILQCVMACTAGMAGISRVDVTPDTVFIHRNQSVLPDDFALERSFPTRGRVFTGA